MIIESEYVGWAVPPFERAPNCGKVTVTTWKKINKSIQTEEDNHSVLKNVLFKILDNRKCKFRADAPIVCAQSVDRNHVLTDVSNVFSYSVKINVSFHKFGSQQKLMIKFVIVFLY